MPNAPANTKQVSDILFSTLQFDAVLEDVPTVLKYNLSAKANDHSQESDEEMVCVAQISSTPPATTNIVQYEHPPEVAPLTVSGFTGMVRLPLQ